MPTDATEISLLRLAAQRLVGPRPATPAEAVGHLLAAQAQDLPGALTSIALRTAEPSGVRAAFDDGAVVRAWPMRGTLHAVPAADLVWMTTLMAPRPLAAAAGRRAELGLDDDALRTARDSAEAALATAEPGLTRAELLAVWQAVGLSTDAGRGYHLIVHLAQTGVLAQGPFRGTEQLFVLVDRWVPRVPRLDHEQALAELSLRYLTGHGPATVADLARWSGLPLGPVRAGVALVADRLEALEVGATTYLLAPGTADLLATHRAQAEAVHLLPGFDEMVLGYADRTATIPAEHAARIVPGNNGVFRPTVLRGGRAIGVWRWVGSGSRRRVEVEAFDGEPPAALLEEVFRAADRLP